MRKRFIPDPAVGTERLIEKFLWWPVCIRVTKNSTTWESRWLEKAAIRQRWDWKTSARRQGIVTSVYGWRNYSWENV